jgi:hypothetical protein
VRIIVGKGEFSTMWTPGILRIPEVKATIQVNYLCVDQQLNITPQN